MFITDSHHRLTNYYSIFLFCYLFIFFVLHTDISFLYILFISTNEKGTDTASINFHNVFASLSPRLPPTVRFEYVNVVWWTVGGDMRINILMNRRRWLMPSRDWSCRNLKLVVWIKLVTGFKVVVGLLDAGSSSPPVSSPYSSSLPVSSPYSRTIIWSSSRTMNRGGHGRRWMCWSRRV